MHQNFSLLFPGCPRSPLSPPQPVIRRCAEITSATFAASPSSVQPCYFKAGFTFKCRSQFSAFHFHFHFHFHCSFHSTPFRSLPWRAVPFRFHSIAIALHAIPGLRAFGIPGSDASEIPTCRFPGLKPQIGLGGMREA